MFNNSIQGTYYRSYPPNINGMPSSNSFLSVSASIVTIDIYLCILYTQEKGKVLSELQPPLSQDFNFNGFLLYIMTTAGGSMNKVAANSIASDLRHFYEVTTQSSKDTFGKIDTLLTRSNLEAFLQHLREEKLYKPAAITEQIWRLQFAIKYIMDCTNRIDYYSRGGYLLKLLTDQYLSLSQKASQKSRSITCPERENDFKVRIL